MDSDTHDPEVLFMMLKESVICFLCLLIKHIDTDQNAGLWLSALICVFLRFLFSLWNVY